MRQIILAFVFMAAAALGVVRYVDHSAKPGADAKSGGAKAMSVNARAAPAPVTSSGYRTVTLQSDSRGHFQVEARVEGRPIGFMVDTGASMIAMRETAAARLGIHPTARDYSFKTQTANGVGKAARVQLSRVEINGITVRDVEAFVIPDDQLSTNLLGMTFLSRVKWTHDRGRLVLEQ